MQPQLRRGKKYYYSKGKNTMKNCNEKTNNAVAMYIKIQIELMTAQLEQMKSLYEQMQHEMIQDSGRKANRLLTIKECKAKYHNLSDYTLREWIRSGKIKAERAGEGQNGKYLINEASLDNAIFIGDSQ